MKLGVLKKEETERQGRESGRIWITSRFFYLFFLYTVFIWSCEALDLIGWPDMNRQAFYRELRLSS